jgi:predicted metal-dependent phosphotriesterase family hydrolase
LLTTFAGDLKSRGVTDELLKRIFVTNPAETFQFKLPLQAKTKS